MHIPSWLRVVAFATAICLPLLCLGGTSTARVRSSDHADLATSIAGAFVATGDAPAAEASHAPRPADARRLHAAPLGDAGFVVSYEVATDASTALAAYARVLEAAGHAPSSSGSAFDKDHERLLVRVQPAGDRALLTIVEVPR
jgi:hypothetical protein